MVDHCANPECGKPLLYLRDGVVYCFEEIDVGQVSSNPFGHRLKHNWLRGNCSISHLQERTDEQVFLTCNRLHSLANPVEEVWLRPFPKHRTDVA